MKSILKLIKMVTTILCGADMSILRLCPEDKIDYIKKEFVIFTIVGITIYTTQTTSYWFLYGVSVLLLYKLFLSNLNLISIGNKSYSFLKRIISSILIIGLIFSLIKEKFDILAYTIYSFVYIDVEDYYDGILNSMLIILIIICAFAICYYPVRFKLNKDTLYAKTYKQYLNIERIKAEEKINDKLNKQTQQDEIQKNINKQIEQEVEKEYINKLTTEIIDTRMRVAKLALAKWEEEQKKKVNENIDEYINNLE